MRSSSTNGTCGGFVPVEDNFACEVKTQGLYPDCKSCIYFSSRNCGKNIGLDMRLMGNPFFF